MLKLPNIPPRIIPCLLLYEDAFVKTIKFKDTFYIGDPINTINLFNKFEVDEIAVFDITCVRKGSRPNFELIKDLASECWVPLSYGGGIKSVDDAKRILNSGVEKISFESFIFTNPQEIRKCVEEFGSSSVVGCINVKSNILGKYEVRTQGYKKKVSKSLIDVIDLLREINVGEIVVNHISRDGTRKGYDLNLINTVSQLVDCPVVALGGADKISDFKAAIQAGASAASSGASFVFQNNDPASVLINYPERQLIEKIFNE